MSDCYILKIFENFYFKTINSKFILPKFKPMFKLKCEKNKK